MKNSFSEFIAGNGRDNILAKFITERVAKQATVPTNQITATFMNLGESESLGISTSYFFTPDLLLGFKISSDEKEASPKKSMDYTYRTKHAGFFGKYFFANSFYFDLGLGVRKSDFSYTKTYPFYPNAGSRTSSVYEHWLHLGPEVSLGNQWQWESFTFGVDWLSLYHPWKTYRKLRHSDLRIDQDPQNQPAFDLGHTTYARIYVGFSW